MLIEAAATRPRAAISLHALRNGALWLLVASGSLVLVEPSPYEGLFAVALLAFGLTLKFDRGLAPLVACLALFITGSLLSLIPWTQDHDSVAFAVTSAYVAATAIFFACVTLERPIERIGIIRHAYIVAAVIGSMAGIAGYFDIAGLGDAFTKFDRATGTFKDPNVLGPFLVVALVWMGQRALVGERRGAGAAGRPAAAVCFLVVAFGLFLTFSRGAWGVCVASFLMMIALTFVTARAGKLRRRIIVVAALGLVAVVTLLAIALSFQAIRDVFEVRFSLTQEYDLGETGRFGNQWRSIPLLLEAPNGFGPLQFRHLFAEEDPHDVYINAFASYGWLGGFAYCTLMLMTVYVGSWLVLRRSPVQGDAIVLWSCLFVQILQGFQIDTDHWRHFYLMLGCVWGLAAATRRRARAGRPATGPPAL